MDDETRQPAAHNQVRSARNVVQAGSVRDVIINPGRKPPNGKMIAGAVAVVVVVAVAVSLVFVLRRNDSTSGNDATGNDADTGTPVAVVVQNNADPARGGAVWALPGALEPAPTTVTVGPQLASLVNGQSSAQLGALSLTLVLTGQYTHSVVVTGLRAVIGKHTDPLAGTLLYAPTQGISTAVDGCVFLAEATPLVREASPSDDTCNATNKSYFADHDVTLDRNERTVVNLVIQPKTGYYEFELVLDVVANGKPAQVPIRNGPNPFRVTTFAQSYHLIFAPSATEHVLDRADPAVFCPDGCLNGPHG